MQGYICRSFIEEGALNVVPDALSRMFEITLEALSAIRETIDPWYINQMENIRKFPKKYRTWRIEDDQLHHHRHNPITDLTLKDLDASKLVLPHKARLEAIEHAHNPPQAGHMGIDKTYHRLAQDFSWQGMVQDVAQFVKRCRVCQLNKVSQGPLLG